MARRHAFIIVSLLSVFAALRVLIFSAAFPIFSQVDEEMHFDLILRYAHGDIPHQFDLLTPETLNWVVPYASPEFLQDPKKLPEHRFPPPLWKQSGEAADNIAQVTRLQWSKEINWESSQPPLYYSVAALWWKIGKLIGFAGISAIYWLRFFNAVLICGLVWISYAAARSINSSDLTFAAGVALLVACFPQDIFFVINNDALSAFSGGLIFLCAARVLTAASPTLSLAATTGLSLAAGYLTKISNAPLALVIFSIVLAKIVWRARARWRNAAAAASALCLTALTPVAVWTASVRRNFGDFTGSIGKADLLGWTMKSFSNWWNHPIFSGHGLWAFWSDFAARFWHGELMWHGSQVNWPPADTYYSVGSLIALLAAAIGILRNDDAGRAIVAAAVLSFLASVGFLIGTSIAFDFGQCIYPSRSFPYLTAGRLIIGTLVPFVIVFVYGVRRLFDPLNSKLAVGTIIATASLMFTSQVILDSRVFGSEHNWFHR